MKARLGPLELYETAYRLLEASVCAETVEEAQARVSAFVDGLPASEVHRVLKVIAVEFGWRHVSRTNRGEVQARVDYALQHLATAAAELAANPPGGRVVVPFERRNRR